MAKFNLGLSSAAVKAGAEAGAAEGREAWSGELPPTGVYTGILKVLSTGVIGENAVNAGAQKLAVGVELVDAGEYTGFLAWGNLNIIESSLPYINQFLLALTDGSEEQFALIKKAFYETGPTADERKKHILKIGRWNINSPKGELPMKVSLKNDSYYSEATKETKRSVKIVSYLVDEDRASSGPATPAEGIVEEEATVELDADESATEAAVGPTDDEALLQD